MFRNLLLVLLTGLLPLHSWSWGFYAHKMINRMAVFSLPPEMFGFYKYNIDYITEHAVDPDKRRYQVKEEGVRHFIDADHYEHALPFDTLPMMWKDAAAKFSEDTLNKYGIVPWYIQIMLHRLSDAMKEKNQEEILKCSADIGHYVADAHVPLHSTENYNGQFSGQQGIHGFWESRLPELFSNDYDFFNGRAVYLDKPLKSAWIAVDGSFNALDSVLRFEKTLQAQFPEEKRYSFEEKGGKPIKIYSVDYSKAYHDKLHGMVERRMKASMLAVASFWYTAWVDAGQPDLSSLLAEKPVKLSAAELKQLQEQERKMLVEQQMKGRDE